MFKRLQAIVCLWKQLGEERFSILVSLENRSKVKEFCDQILKETLTPTMTVGDRTYKILSFSRKDEGSMNGYTMVERAKEMSAHLGKDDGEYLLEHQLDIPVALRRNVIFVFTDWRCSSDSDLVQCVWWNGNSWKCYWYRLDCLWNGFFVRVLRRLN